MYSPRSTTASAGSAPTTSDLYQIHRLDPAPPLDLERTDEEGRAALEAPPRRIDEPPLTPYSRAVLPRLITIPISHYGERARWALDRAGVEYEERHVLQMFSWGAALVHGGRTTVPILVLPDRTLTDSADIVAWAAERAGLLPAGPSERAEALRLSAEFAGAYGVETRRIVYEWLLRAPREGLRFNEGRAPRYQAAVLRAALPVVGAFLARYLGVSPDNVERGKALVDRTFDAVAERLTDGRRYLVGEAFSVADLTFAAMTAPALLPARYGVPLPPLSQIPDDAARRIQALREHPTGRFVLRLYDEERPAPRGQGA